MPKPKTIETVWSVRTYDVWGNAKDGYEVNDTYSRGTVTLSIPVTVNNAGTPQQFESAYPTDSQLREVFGIGRTQIETDGDDLHIMVNRSRDAYPIGELFCESHESLSPIRVKAEVTK
jgi:hypothetical protein